MMSKNIASHYKTLQLDRFNSVVRWQHKLSCHCNTHILCIKEVELQYIEAFSKYTDAALWYLAYRNIFVSILNWFYWPQQIHSVPICWKLNTYAKTRRTSWRWRSEHIISRHQSMRVCVNLVLLGSSHPKSPFSTVLGGTFYWFFWVAFRI